MKTFLLSACVLLVIVGSAFAQDDFSAIHREDFARWAQLASLSPSDIHQMWRSTSHYANEADDDSSIDLVDVSSLRFRNQILMVTSAGLPRCLTVAVFSAQRPAFTKIWQVSQTPDGQGFCDTLDVTAAVNVGRSGEIEITSALRNGATEHPSVSTYLYKWEGNSYLLDTNMPPKSQAHARNQR